ncbi:MAG: signal peptide peptidase SppA [Pirellulales bacterium]|nr:signal peptide peptidase SppA [Pirellulales bacterium]
METGPTPENPYQQAPVDAQVVHPSPQQGYRQPPPQTPPPGFPPPRPPRRRRSVLGVFFTIMLITALGMSVLINMALISGNMLSSDAELRIKEQYVSHKRMADNKIAIISVEGTIISGEGFVKRQIDKAMKDDSVKAVVVRVDSPGGTITGSDYIYHHLCQLAKKREIPIVVSMGGMAASGGYYVSMAVGDTPDTIFAEPTTWTGSIGVVIPHYDLSKLLTDWGISEDSIASHRLKTMGSFAKPMTEEERKIFQTLVDDSFTRFKDIIKSGRPKFKEDSKALDKLATGQVFNAVQAEKDGLVDKIGFVEDAIERAIELANVAKDNVMVVKYKREASLASIIMGGNSSAGQIDLAAILDAATPRGYYLCTWLPAAVSNQ